MLRRARGVDPEALFVVSMAERLPIATASVELITAAGSLNYVDLSQFFREAARILTPGGGLLVYDFRSGRTGTSWFDTFVARYPWAPNEARALSPAILGGMNSGFRLGRHQEFEIAISMTRDAYVEYMLTETNVAAAVRSGVHPGEVRTWCAASLADEWGDGPREVRFAGYFAWLTVT